jgi:hypothetical protein
VSAVQHEKNEDAKGETERNEQKEEIKAAQIPNIAVVRGRNYAVRKNQSD